MRSLSLSQFTRDATISLGFFTRKQGWFLDAVLGHKCRELINREPCNERVFPQDRVEHHIKHLQTARRP